MPKSLPSRGVYGPYQRDTATGPSFFIQFEGRFAPGKGRRGRKQITLQAKNPSLTYAEAVEYGRRFEAGLFDPWRDKAEPVTLCTGIDRWIAHNPHLSEHTLKERRITLDRFADGLPSGGAKLDPRDVTPGQVEAFTHAPNLKPSTRAGYFSKVRAYFNWLKKEGYVRDNPCDDVEKPKARKRPPKYLSRYQYGALLAQAHSDAERGEGRPIGPTWMPDLVELGVATVLRRSELCALRWCDVDLKNGRVYARNYTRDDGEGNLIEHRTKSGHDRAVPIFSAARINEDETAPVLLSERRRHLSPNYVTGAFRECRKRAKLPDWVTPHSLRHTFVSWLVSDGTPLFHVSKWMGHSSQRVTERYAYLVPEERERGTVFSLPAPDEVGDPSRKRAKESRT